MPSPRLFIANEANAGIAVKKASTRQKGFARAKAQAETRVQQSVANRERAKGESMPQELKDILSNIERITGLSAGEFDIRTLVLRDLVVLEELLVYFNTLEDPGR